MPHAIEDYRVELDAYNGPLDLLLFLVRRNEIDLHDIPISRLTDQYLAYLKQIRAIDVDLAGEFLVMSATLLEIKSQMLIPRNEEETQEEASASENPADPRYELVQQLLAYKRYKDAAMELDALREEWEARVPCHPGRLSAKQMVAGKLPKQPETDEEWENQPEPEVVEVDLEDASVNDLCAAFARILSSIGDTGKAGHAVVYDDTPIGLHAEDIMDRLNHEGPLTLQKMFSGRTRRSEMIGLFLATLELVRLKKIKVVQDQVAGEIRLEPRPEAEQLGDQDSAAVDWRDPQTGQMQYEWASEADHKRALRRERLRMLAAERMKKKDQGDAEDAELPDEEDLDVDADMLDEDEQAMADAPVEQTPERESADGETGDQPA